MQFEKIGIVTARIHGLNKPCYYFEAKCFWAFDIMFSGLHTLSFNLPFIYLSEDSEEEANQTLEELKKNFSDAGISDGNLVAILVGDNGDVRAIGAMGCDMWIDVKDKFVPKTFKELDIIITSLSVH